MRDDAGVGVGRESDVSPASGLDVLPFRVLVAPPPAGGSSFSLLGRELTSSPCSPSADRAPLRDVIRAPDDRSRLRSLRRRRYEPRPLWPRPRHERDSNARQSRILPARTSPFLPASLSSRCIVIFRPRFAPFSMHTFLVPFLTFSIPFQRCAPPNSLHVTLSCQQAFILAEDRFFCGNFGMNRIPECLRRFQLRWKYLSNSDLRDVSGRCSCDTRWSGFKILLENPVALYSKG